MTDARPPRSFAQIFFAYIAIAAGTMAFLQAGMRGHRVGWEEMALYTGPAVVGALIAVAMRRNRLGFTALLFGVLSVVGFVLGA